MLADLRSTFRRLARAPGLSCAALLAIALGVSAATTAFSLLNAVLLRSLPFGNADRLVYLWTPLPNTTGLPRERQPFYSDLAAWRKLSASFQDITAMQRYIALLDDLQPQRVGAARVLGTFFETLEAHPALGRTIQSADDRLGKQFVAVISDGLWRARFAADTSIVGKKIRLDRQSYRVIGVMPKEFSYPHGNDFPGQYQFASLPRTDIWVPAALTPKQQASQEFAEFDAAIGRLRPGVSLSQAQGEISALEKRLNPLHGAGWRDLQALLVPFVETSLGPVRSLLRLLTGAALLVLLIACTNFGSLLLARAADRSHEIAVRAALGAGRANLIRLVLAESLLLSVAGAGGAAAASWAFVKIAVKLNPGDIPRLEEARVDGGVLLFGLSVAVITGLLAGILPALAGSLVNIGGRMSSGARAIAGASWRQILIVAQIALSVVLLAAASLLIRSYLSALGEDKGFAEAALTMSVMVDPQARNPDQLRREAMNRIRALPGVLAAGSIDDLPLSANEDKGFLQIEGVPLERKAAISVRETGGDYFRAMQIPLIAGRYLDESDIAGAPAAWPRAVVVSKTFAQRYFKNGTPIGNRLRINRSAWALIVGVVGDVRHASLEQAPEPTVYCQNGLADSVVIRTARSPDSMAAAVRRALGSLSAGLAVTDIQTMGRYISQAAARRRFQTAVLTAFAGAALLLTLVGLYGLLTYAVGQRTSEIGIRLAVGASRGAILGMIASYGLKLTAAGLAIGLFAALLLTRFVAGFLYGVAATDGVTFVAAPLSILLVAAAACSAPAWRAARIDPLRALRH